MKAIYKIRIELIYSEPLIWREFYVEANTLLPEFHEIIQIIMGWENAHMHQFIHDRNFYGMPDPYDELGTIDYQDVKISDLLTKKKEALIYEYDFGDSWEHKIVLKSIEETVGFNQLPYCEKGKMACPPEDCGGIPGYENLVRVLSNPEDEEYEDMIMWLGGKYNAELLEIDKINKNLKLNFR